MKTKCLFGRLVALATVMAGLCSAPTASAAGWPANYQGVMLQGFSWDDYTNSSWKTLTGKADEYSKYFKLIWVPNSAQAAGQPNMGYMPIYWFPGHHNSSFGSESELRAMIAAYKAKGTGIIEDVVINHRVGVNNWADFPSETWNGKTYKLGNDAVCRTDEWASNGGNPTGANDTGDDFNGARDLDHTNATVQSNVKAYLNCLLNDLGYAGFRYDMVKGYDGYYTKIYNQSSNPTYSVGEYWDASYDAVTGWINKTDKQSAAFDFPMKYAINEAFSSGNMTKLSWKYTDADQCAGIAHNPEMRRWSVTFVDNHDTARDGSRFPNDNLVEAANAYILSMPGTPCVFLPHYIAHKAAIQKMINARNSVGVHNQSTVNVLKNEAGRFVAEVTGTKGKLMVKVGSNSDAGVSTAGWTLAASGNNYAVWTSGNGGQTPVDPDPEQPDPVDMPSALYLMGNLKDAQWNTSASPAMTRSGNTFMIEGAVFEPAQGETLCYFNLATALGADWNAVNASDRYGADTEGSALTPGMSAPMTFYAANVNASAAKSWTIAPGTYSLVADFSDNTIKIVEGSHLPDTPVNPGNARKLYITGENYGNWTADEAYAMTYADGTYSYLFAKGIEGEWKIWDGTFNGDSWAYSFGAGGDQPVIGAPYQTWFNSPANFTFNTTSPVRVSLTVTSGSDTEGSSIPASMIISKASGIVTGIVTAESIWYTLQGIRVDRPEAAGIYVKVTGNKAEKVIIR